MTETAGQLVPTIEKVVSTHVIKRYLRYPAFLTLSLPFAARTVLELYRHYPEVFQRTQVGDTGLSYFSRLRGILVLAWAGRIFYWNHGHWPDLIEPKSLTEKIFARKFCIRMSQPVIEDKTRRARFADLSTEVLVKTPEMKMLSSEPQLAELDGLPPSKVFLKLNRRSGTNTKLTLPLSEKERKAVERRMADWLELTETLRLGEWWNDRIEPIFFIEEVISPDDGRQVDDWKFYVSGGRVILVQNDFDRFIDHTRNIYDRNGQLLEASIVIKRAAKCRTVPKQFGEMVRAAEAIGRLFDFVRVDLYTLGPDQLWLGELTLVPGSGVEPITPPALNLELGAAYAFRHGASYFDQTCEEHGVASRTSR